MKKSFLIILLITLAIVAFIFSINTISLSPGNPGTKEDYSVFIAPNEERVEKARAYIMRPYNFENEKAGYNPEAGFVQGGFYGGEGFQDGHVLINSNLLIGSVLDYLNSQKGINTNIEGNTRQWLQEEFIDPETGDRAFYNGKDRREIMYGKVLGCVRRGDSEEGGEQRFYPQGHLPEDEITIVSAFPGRCFEEPSESRTYKMNIQSIWIELYYLNWQRAKAKRLSKDMINEWQSTPGTGVDGTTGGYFSDKYDSGNCKSTRTLAYWIHLARVTGYWKSIQDAERVTQEVQNQLWAHQKEDGGIRVNYLGCGNDEKVSAESVGLTLLAYDPRIRA